MRNNSDAAAIYSRKSKFTGKGESICNQIELCKEFICSHYGDTAADNAVIYEDEGFSGGNLNRPGFKKMMTAAKNHEFCVIVVYRLDRISRNISDFSGLIEELNRLNVSFVSIKEQFDTETPMGRAMMYIASVFSQLERETIAERIRDNMHELAKTGRWLGGVTPTGYTSEAVKSITIDGKPKRSCKLKLISHEADVVKSIFNFYNQTNSLTLTEAELIKHGIKSKNNKYFTRFSIKSILQNPVYMIADRDAYDYFTKNSAELFSDMKEFDGIRGIMAYNRTYQVKGRPTKFLPINDWIVSVSQHHGIIPGKMWVSVQESLDLNKLKSYRKPRKNEALLSGLLFCSCGERMYPKLSNRTTADGKQVYTYVCKMKERSKGTVCNINNVPGGTLDSIVIEQIKALYEDDSNLVDQLERSKKLVTGSFTCYENELREARNKKTELEKKMISLIDSLADIKEQSGKDYISKRIEELCHESKRLNEMIGDLEINNKQSLLSDTELACQCKILTEFKALVDIMPIEQKRQAVRGVINKVIWDGNNAHLILIGNTVETIDYLNENC